MPLKVSQIPLVTREQMQQLDQVATTRYGVDLLQMMENAGRGLAEVVRLALGGSVDGRTIVVLAGKGNNGGGGLSAARFLHNFGGCVKVMLAEHPVTVAAQKQLSILQNLGVNITVGETALQKLPQTQADVWIDALLGYNARGAPRGTIARFLAQFKSRNETVVSLDVPTGLDPDTGKIYTPCIQAHFTVTLALPKVGLMHPGARPVVGRLFLADIGIPPQAWAEIQLPAAPIFVRESLLEITSQPPTYLWQQCSGIILE